MEFPLDYERIFLGTTTWAFALEIVVRTTAMFLYAVLLFRIFLGKRAISALSPFELVIVIALGSALGDPMMNAELPLVQGILVLTVLVLLNKGLVLWTNRSRHAERLLEGAPTRLVIDGRLDCAGLEKAVVSREEVFIFLRQHGVEHLGQVKRAYLETNGTMSLFRYARESEKPGLAILPPAEVEPGSEAILRQAERAAGPVWVCCSCGATPVAGGAAPPAACPYCGGEEWTPAITQIEDVSRGE